MPSVRILDAKKAMVDELSTKIKSSASGVIVTYTGITVEDDTKLRAELRGAGVHYRVYKNSITGRACEGAGYADLGTHLVGMTAIALSESDVIAPAKILKKYADKIDSFSIKGGFVEGDILDAAGVTTLAEIPSFEVLVAKLMGSMRSPLYGMVYALQAVIDKSGEAVPAAEATPTEEAIPAPEVVAEEAAPAEPVADEAPVEETPAE